MTTDIEAYTAGSLAVQLITGAGTGARPLTTTALRRAL